LCTGVGVGACGGIIGTSTNVPINRRQHDHQFVYNHTFSFARHTLKVGIDHRKQLLDDVTGDRARGFWTFGSNETLANIQARNGFTSFENFMRGFINTYQKGYGNPFAENRFGDTSLYLQDDLRLKRNLTVNLGVRYEYVRAPKEAKNRFDYIVQDDKNNIEPRFGFAYSPAFEDGFLQKLTGGPGKFVIRGGYGINHTRIFQSIYSQNQLSIRTQPPNGYADVFSGRCPNEISDPACGFVFTPGFAVFLDALYREQRAKYWRSARHWRTLGFDVDHSEQAFAVALCAAMEPDAGTAIPQELRPASRLRRQSRHRLRLV
jgi:hypothetical protein